MVGGEDVKCIVHTSIRSTLYTTVWFPNSVDEENNWLPCLGQGKLYLKTMNYMYSTYEPAKRNCIIVSESLGCITGVRDWTTWMFNTKTIRDVWHLTCTLIAD